MNRGTRAVTAALWAALSLSACQQQPAEEPQPAARLPEQVCKQAREGLDKLGGSGAFEYQAEGTATINESAWLAMGDSQRDGLARTLGIHAACSAAEPTRETEVIVRNEFGRVLVQRVIETSTDLSEILQ